MDDHRFAAIILAAGYSARMGKFKPLLPVGCKTVIEHTISAFRQIGCQNLVVVTGHCGDEVRRLVKPLGVQVVLNTAYADGMFSSVKVGVNRLNREKIEAFFITPGDICLIRPLTIRLLVDAYEKAPGRIIHPCLGERRGHPPLIPTTLLPPIINSNGDGGLKTILEKQNRSAICLQVPDRHMLKDMNRLKDYEDTLLRFQNHDIPTEAECEIILSHVCQVPETIVRHSHKVAQIARRIHRRLRQAGVVLDPGLIAAGALLHDIAKGQKNHGAVAARMLSEMGFPRIARIVSVHTDLGEAPPTEITEAGIVYMADKLVMGTRTATLEERFARALARYGHDPEARTAIERRKAVTMALKEKMEQETGVTINEMIRPTQPCREFGDADNT